MSKAKGKEKSDIVLKPRLHLFLSHRHICTMSLLRVAARRATPMIARAGRQQARQASSGSPHYDPFALDPVRPLTTF